MSNLILGSRGTRVTFEASGGTVVLTLTSLGANAGRISATHDKGAGSQEVRYIGGLRIQVGDAPVAGEVLRVYVIEQVEARNGGSPAFKVPGDLGSSDAAIADEDRFMAGGVTQVGSLRIPPSPAVDTEYVATFEFETRARKFQMGVWSALADVLTATASEHELWIEEVDPEIQ